jgi:hypothetical protein
MFRSCPRLFKTFKASGMCYRLTRNVWWDFFRQLKKIWKEPSVMDQDFLISDNPVHTDNKRGIQWN